MSQFLHLRNLRDKSTLIVRRGHGSLEQVVEEQSADLRKKRKTLIEPDLRIIAQEEHLSQLRDLFHPLEVKARLYEFFETEGCT